MIEVTVKIKISERAKSTTTETQNEIEQLTKAIKAIIESLKQ